MTIYAGVYGPTGIEYPDGRHALGIYVLVREVPSGDLATLYVNAQKTGVAPNPCTTDALGNLRFYAEPGDYTLEFPTMAPGGYEVPDMEPIEVTVPLWPDEPVAGDELGYRHVQSIAADIWDCPYPLGFRPAGIRVFVNGVDTLTPITYGVDRVYAHHGAPCTGYVEMS